MHYELVRSNRRTLAITIDGSGRCVVRAPMRMPMAEQQQAHFSNNNRRQRQVRGARAHADAYG